MSKASPAQYHRRREAKTARRRRRLETGRRTARKGRIVVAQADPRRGLLDTLLGR